MIIAEPVQNAGGALVPPEGYWAGLRALADRYGIALVADEVITGFGRIGEWFAVQRFGAAPDVITLAKGITSAYAPMGAVVVSDRIAEPLYDDGRMLLHGITFGGHPVAAAYAEPATSGRSSWSATRTAGASAPRSASGSCAASSPAGCSRRA